MVVNLENDVFKREIRNGIERSLSPARAAVDRARAALLDRMYFTDIDGDDAIISVRKGHVDYHADFTRSPSQERATAIYLKDRGDGNVRQYHLVQENNEDVAGALRGEPTAQTLKVWQREIPKINNQRVDDMLKALAQFEASAETRLDKAEKRASDELQHLKRKRDVLAPSPVEKFLTAGKELLASLRRQAEDTSEQDENPLSELDQQIQSDQTHLEGIKLYRGEYATVLRQMCKERRNDLLQSRSSISSEWMKKEIQQVTDAYKAHMLNSEDLTSLTLKWQDALNVSRGVSEPDQKVVPFTPPVKDLDNS